MPDAASRRRLARLHAGLVAATLLCTTAFVVELLRAQGGNTLSWAYVFEWPILLAYGIYMWWRLVREERGGPGQHAPAPTPRDDEDDAALDAWNRYLAELHAADSEAAHEHGRPRPPSPS